MTDYSKMSDMVLNGLVMDILSDGNQYHRPGDGCAIELLREVPDVEFGEHVVNYDSIGMFDPCNSWADAGPIIKEKRIPLNPFRDRWIAGGWRGVNDKNPLRAAMIAFLMMKDSEKEQGNG